MKHRTVRFGLASIAALAVASVCAQELTRPPDVPRYFQRIRTTFQEPIALTGEMSEASAIAHSRSASLYIGWFDPSGRLMRYEKHHGGTILRLVYYTYENRRLVQVRTVDETGREIVHKP